MQCKYSKCSIELSNPRAKFCSDRCRMAWNRLTRTDIRVKPEQNRPEQGGASVPEQERSAILGQSGDTETDKSVGIEQDQPTAYICGHCEQPVPIRALTCCQGCSLAGKGRVSETRKRELGIGVYGHGESLLQPSPLKDVDSTTCQHVRQALESGRGSIVQVSDSPVHDDIFAWIDEMQGGEPRRDSDYGI